MELRQWLVSEAVEESKYASDVTGCVFCVFAGGSKARGPAVNVEGWLPAAPQCVHPHLATLHVPCTVSLREYGVHEERSYGSDLLP